MALTPPAPNAPSTNATAATTYFRNSTAPVSDQLRILALARWQAFRNSMRRKQKRFELVFKLLFWLSAASTMVFGGLGFFATSYFLFPKKPAMLIVLFSVLFAVWQLMPLALEGQSPALDFIRHSGPARGIDRSWLSAPGRRGSKRCRRIWRRACWLRG